VAEHEPVLVEEAVDALAITAHAGSPSLYVDATFGRGGHAARILERLGPEERLLALDRDPAAIAAAGARFGAEPRVVVVGAAFSALASLVKTHGEGRACRGILFDLGVSSPQLEDPARGFSFQADGPLDMRMDTTRGESAAAWLARAPGDEIRDVIRDLGEERHAGRIARGIVEARGLEPITRTGQLAQLITRVRGRDGGKHPATRSFQAIRMHVNDELGELARGLDAALEALVPGGRLAVISFHSLEDRMVKHFMRHQAQPDPQWTRLPVAPEFTPALRLVGKKQRAGDAELQRNPRARSAILRVAERLDAPPVKRAA
jgi:16S rRNA (cytosine1402-N4)-methyltransferase